MSYTSEADKMPSPKALYFKITTPKSINLIEIGFWAKNYKPTQYYSFRPDGDNLVHYFAFDEEKSAANMTTLIKNYLGGDTEMTTVVIKTREEFDSERNGSLTFIPFVKSPPSRAIEIVKESSRHSIDEISINMKINNVKVIDSIPATVVCTDKDLESIRVHMMKTPQYVLRSFDIHILNPECSNNGVFSIPAYYNNILTGISVSSGEFSLDLNGTERGKSINGHLDLTLVPGKKGVPFGHLQQELAVGAEDSFIESVFKTSDGGSTYPCGQWLNITRIQIPILRGLDPNNTITLHCIKLHLEDSSDPTLLKFPYNPIIKLDFLSPYV